MQESNILVNYDLKSKLVKELITEFTKPIFLNRYFINLDALKINSDIVPFNKNTWDQNPQQFCFDYYKIYEYYLVILLVNNIKSMFYFKKDNLNKGMIIAPKEDKIISILW